MGLGAEWVQEGGSAGVNMEPIGCFVKLGTDYGGRVAAWGGEQCAGDYL